MNQFPFPPDEPTYQPNWFARIFIFASMIVLLIMFLCIYQFAIGPLVNEHTPSSDDQSFNSKLLDPGFHLVSDFPYILVVKHGTVGIQNEDGITIAPDIEIPEGSVGVITNKKDGYVHMKALPPGRYKINPDLYKVDEIFTGKQVWQFGIGEEITE